MRYTDATTAAAPTATITRAATFTGPATGPMLIGARPGGRAVALILIVVTNLDDVIGSGGRPVADALMAAVTERARAVLGDAAASVDRFPGDPPVGELCVIADNLTRLDEAAHLTDAVCQEVARLRVPVRAHGGTRTLSGLRASGGWAGVTGPQAHAVSMTRLWWSADAALYTATRDTPPRRRR